MRFLAMSLWMGLCVLQAGFTVRAGEEKIRGILEKTAKLEACAQITDALNELYYVAKSDAAEKMIANFIGKNQKVELVGTIENKPNESVPYINIKSATAYAPKMPQPEPAAAPAPAPAAAPATPAPAAPNAAPAIPTPTIPAPAKLDEKKPDEKKSEPSK